MTEVEKIIEGLTKAEKDAALIADLTIHWGLFCDADPMPCDREEFLSRLLDQGFVELVDVDDDALDDPFAWERGIEPGGMMWRLTPLGLQVKAALEAKK